MTAWVQQIENRAKLIHSEIALWQSRAVELGIDLDLVCGPFYKILNDLYSEDLPLAKARDSSDLLLHIEGAAVDDIPRLSLVSSVFSNVKGQVRDLTKAIFGIVADHRLPPHEVDLGLSGLAKGSLFVGFNVAPFREQYGQRNLLGNDDLLFQATKNALRTINAVSHTIEFSEAEEATLKVAEIVSDPLVRDAALVAVRRIAPTGRAGVSRIGVTSSSDERGLAVLTPDSRRQIGKMLERPVQSKEVMEFEGVVREIDLDAKRFDLRGIANEKVQDIRCVYVGLEEVHPRRLLDSKVRVRGLVERRADEVPRLLAVSSVEFLDNASSQQLDLLDK
jgi:hypothetical protein